MPVPANLLEVCGYYPKPRQILTAPDGPVKLFVLPIDSEMPSRSGGEFTKPKDRFAWNKNLTDDGLFRYYYDCENRLTDVNDQNDSPVASYGYDFAGRRIWKTVYGSPDVTTKYCGACGERSRTNGDQVIAEYDGGGSLKRKFIYGPGIDEPLCMIDVAAGNAVYYYHFDGLGSVVALSDVNSVIVERYSYDVFGAPTIYDAGSSEIPQSVVGNPYMFTARRADDETALYYYRARYYAFDIGRFLQTDPIGYVDSLNLYTYCGNNPVMFMDPDGELHFLITGVIGGVAGAITGGVNAWVQGQSVFKGAVVGAAGGAVSGVLAGLSVPLPVAGAIGGAASSFIEQKWGGKSVTQIFTTPEGLGRLGVSTFWGTVGGYLGGKLGGNDMWSQFVSKTSASFWETFTTGAFTGLAGDTSNKVVDLTMAVVELFKHYRDKIEERCKG